MLTGGAMMGVMMKGDKDILTIMMKGDGPINGVTVTADSHGNVKDMLEILTCLFLPTMQAS